MTNEVESFSKWIPIVGTLGGATLGFSASLLTTWFNNRAINLRSKDDRNRNRLESIYELLIEIQLDYTSLTGKGTMYFVKGDKVIYGEKEKEKISPRIKLEMMISLYFPEFRQEWESLKSTLKSSEDDFMLYISTLVASRKLYEIDKSSEAVRKRVMSPEFLVLDQLSDNVNQRVIEFQLAIIRTIQG